MLQGEGLNVAGLAAATGHPTASAIPSQVAGIAPDQLNSAAAAANQPIPQVPPQTNPFNPDGTPKPEHMLSAIIEDEEDDEEDEETVLARVPEDTRLLRHYITASQGFLLLLNLRQHLKDLYGFSDAKISQYSPIESAKVYEKAVSRKNNQHFNPKNTLQRLKDDHKQDEEIELDEEGRRKLVKEYLDFKQLVLKFDPEEPDDDNDDDDVGNSSTFKTPRAKTQAAGSSELDRSNEHVQYQVTQVPDQASAAVTPGQGPPRVPKLTIHATHHHSVDKDHHRSSKHHRTPKSEKPKRHKKKKRRRLSDSSDSADDYSDPDFAV